MERPVLPPNIALLDTPTAATYSLIHATGAELEELVAVAGATRDAGRGRTVTYSRKVFIPLTNLCRDKCGYCTFAKAPRHPDAHTMDPEEVLAVAQAGAEQGCKEALLSLGEKPEERYALARNQLKRLGYASTTAYLAAMCDLVVERAAVARGEHPDRPSTGRLGPGWEVCPADCCPPLKRRTVQA